MMGSSGDEGLNRKAALSISFRLIATGLHLIKQVMFRPRAWEQFSYTFADLFSRLWDYAEHSISHQGFTLPTALGNDAVHSVNHLLSELYGGKFVNISLGGSSGALITLLTAVLPKLHPDKDLILFDDMCHQSAVGGYAQLRWI